MLNILIPMGGPNTYPGSEFSYPKPLIEIDGRPMIEWVVGCLQRIKEEKRFIFIINKKDAQEFHLRNILLLIGGENSQIIEVDRETKGAVCSALMAIDHINNDTPLLISSSDHIIFGDLDAGLGLFRAQNYAAGLYCFDSVHPKWSFARLDDEGLVIETAEKRPISRNAIAGLYYYRSGAQFIQAGMKSILKGSETNGLYYVSSTINELILTGKRVGKTSIPNENYFNFYSPEKIREFERHLEQSGHKTFQFPQRT